MGWASGTNAEGREVGYSVEATCDDPLCDEAIDRGLAYCCGDMHDGGQRGCGRYFCHTHLYGSSLCAGCDERAELRAVVDALRTILERVDGSAGEHPVCLTVADVEHLEELLLEVGSW